MYWSSPQETQEEGKEVRYGDLEWKKAVGLREPGRSAIRLLSMSLLVIYLSSSP